MKALLLLLLLAACGKHEMPPEEDMRDSDGDLIPNYREADMDKYISEIVPLQEIETEIEFKTGVDKSAPQKYLLSNKIDIQKYSTELLLKNKTLLQSNDYFSEFTQMKLKAHQKVSLVDPGVIRLTLRSTHTDSTPKSVFIVYPDKRLSLGEWTQNMEVTISSDDLNAVLKGEAYLAISNLTEKLRFLDKSQDSTVREKTFRVVINDGGKTEILYISKELTFEGILHYFKIASWKNIDEQNLVSMAVKTDTPEWWVRRINQRDIIIVNQDLQTLTESYFEGFEKKVLTFTRLNGYAQNEIIFDKHPEAKVLLKIRGTRSMLDFKLSTKKDSGNSGMEGYWVCKYHHRSASPGAELTISREEVENRLKQNGLQIGVVKALTDKKGAYWEVEVLSSHSQVVMRFENLAQDQYLSVGSFAKDCEGNRISASPPLKFHPVANEASFSLNIEAYVEKI